MGSDDIIAKAARVSTGKDQENHQKKAGLIRYLANEGHTSPFEHTALTVRIEAPIFVAREAMRHRTFSFNEISGRYAKLKPEFYAPDNERPLINAGSGAHPKLVHEEPDPRGSGMMSLSEFTQDVHRDLAEIAWDYYCQLIQEGVATEVARNVLPVGTYTAWYMTGNLHAWFNFLTLRNGSHGSPQYEIVELAKQVETIIERLWPIAYTAWKDSGAI